MSRFNVMPRAYRRLWWKPSLLDRLLRRKPPTITIDPANFTPTNELLTPDNHPGIKR